MKKRLYFAPETKVCLSQLRTYMVETSEEEAITIPGDDGDALGKERGEIGSNQIW